MRLFIAEKPSLAKAIAAVLAPPHRPNQGFIECGQGDVVAWCAGHILEQAAPDHYDDRYKKWQLEHLPIAPVEWKLVVKTPELLRTIRTLLKRADRVVHAGDPDREGQLLIDEVLVFLGYHGHVDRLLINDLNPSAVRRALGALQPNTNFRQLYDAALARQRSDWLFGLNMTRLYTLLGRDGGYDGVLSVGRVQTPVLYLVVQRDLTIENFQPKPFFVLTAKIVAAGGSFLATWKPGPDAEPFLDDEGRLVSRDQAVAIQRATAGQPGLISRATIERKAEASPLPYSLSELQVDAAKRLGITAKESLDTCQSLYETHRLTTYPRSDCSFLPDDHHAQGPDVVRAMVTVAPELAPFAKLADLAIRSRAWNSAKVTAHHAIIPTPNSRPSSPLTDTEKAVYNLIARRYLAQFYPPYEFNLAVLEATIAGQKFVASGRQIIVPGWREILGAQLDETADDRDAQTATAALPALVEREPVTAAEVIPAERTTKPPKRFTDATLLQAMTGIARYVSDPRIKQILRETDGIGTPATQASIIETLFDRQYLGKKGQQIISTPTGRALIATLPAAATSPDMTALWEAGMRKINDGDSTLDGFLSRVVTHVSQLVARGKQLGPLKVPGARACPRPGCTGHLRRAKGAQGAFLACTKYPDCKQTVQEVRTRPRSRRESA